MPIIAESTHWAIDTPNLSLAWSLSEDGELLLTSLRSPQREWVAKPASVLAVIAEPERPFRLTGVSGSVEDAALIFRGTIEPGGATLISRWTIDEDSSVVTVQHSIENQTSSPVEIPSLTSFRLTIDGQEPVTNVSILTGGFWDEAVPTTAYRLRTFSPTVFYKHWFGVGPKGRSTGEYVPWFALHDPEGGLFTGLNWSGRWRMETQRDQGNLTLGIGISDFQHRLEPGASVTIPGLVIAGYTGTLDDGADAWTRWLRHQWMPPTPEDWPWVQYNHWYAYGGDIDEDRLFAEAEYAAEAGAEVFVIDDGWFRGRLPESYVRGWGDWTEDADKFPSGLRAFGDRCRTLGLRFGLWVEPERADDQGELARHHPDWVAQRNGEPIYRVSTRGREGVHLCLGNPEVQDWMIADLTRVVHDYGVDWLKWDYNLGYGLGCDAAGHGHQIGDGHHAYTLGLYRVLTELRAQCPDLMIENCASGGYRMDLGMLRHSHTNWLADDTYRATSVRQQVQGAGLFLPAEHLNRWVLDERTTYDFRSRMGGAFGFSSFMGDWSEEERASLKHAVQEYKQVRPYLYGKRTLLTGPHHQDWEAWQFVHPDGEKAVILVFREGGSINEITLQPNLLGNEALDVRLEPRESAIFWLNVLE